MGRVQHHAFGAHADEQRFTSGKDRVGADHLCITDLHMRIVQSNGGQQIHAAHKTRRKVADGLGVQLLGRALLFDAALVHQHDAVGHGQRFFLIVRDHDAGDAQLALQRADLAAQLGAHLGIEGRQRLVQQQHARLGRQRPGQGHALLLTTRQLCGVTLRLRRKPHHRQHLLHPLAHGHGRLTAQAKRHVLRRRQIGKQRIALKHHPKPPTRGRPGGDVVLLKKHLPLVRPLDATQNPQQRSLAATRWPQQTDKLTRLHTQVNSTQHRRSVVLLDDVLNAQHGVTFT